MKIWELKLWVCIKKWFNRFLERRVYNGQLGLIIKLDFDEEKCIVLYPNDDMVVFYDFENVHSLLSLAYCLTIHKTQGMEYDNALILWVFLTILCIIQNFYIQQLQEQKNVFYCRWRRSF